MYRHQTQIRQSLKIIKSGELGAADHFHSSISLLDLPVFTTQLVHFAALIEGNQQALISAQESLRNARVREAIIESSLTGQWASVGAS